MEKTWNFCGILSQTDQDGRSGTEAAANVLAAVGAAVLPGIFSSVSLAGADFSAVYGRKPA